MTVNVKGVGATAKTCLLCSMACMPARVIHVFAVVLVLSRVGWVRGAEAKQVMEVAEVNGRERARTENCLQDYSQKAESHSG